MKFKSWSELGKRLMEIKEEQRLWEVRQNFIMVNIDITLTQILKELKNGRRRNTKR